MWLCRPFCGFTRGGDIWGRRRPTLGRFILAYEAARPRSSLRTRTSELGMVLPNYCLPPYVPALLSGRRGVSCLERRMLINKLDHIDDNERDVISADHQGIAAN